MMDLEVGSEGWTEEVREGPRNLVGDGSRRKITCWSLTKHIQVEESASLKSRSKRILAAGSDKIGNNQAR